jgi:hypothetical protein
MHGKVKANGSALPCACGAGLAGVFGWLAGVGVVSKILAENV